MKIETKSVQLVKKFLPEETCRRLIDIHNSSKKFRVDIPMEKSYHYSDPDCDNDLFRGIEIMLKQTLENYIGIMHINDFPNFKAGDFKLLEYGEGDWFVDHYDGDFSEWEEGGYKYHPFTTDICLNKDFEGGEFHINGQTIEMEIGDLLIFPSSFSFHHGVKPIKSGKRLVLVSEPYSLDWGLQHTMTNPEQKKSSNWFKRLLK